MVSLRLIFGGSAFSRSALTQEQVADFFNLDRRLGRRDVNDMMRLLVTVARHVLSQKSSKQEQNGFLRLLARSKNAETPTNRSEEEERRLPFYEAYVLMLSRGRGFVQANYRNV